MKTLAEFLEERVNSCEQTKHLKEYLEKISGITYEEWNMLKIALDKSFNQILLEKDELLVFNKDKKNLNLIINRNFGYLIDRNKRD